MSDDKVRGPSPEHSKDEVRRRALGARDAMPETDRAALSRLVCRRATQLPELQAARVVMVFASFRTEIDTRPLYDWALARGVTLCLPRIVAPRAIEAFRVGDPDCDLQSGTWGIPEPCEGLEQVPPERLDAVIVPGAGFDPDGNRCGYGGGFYDTYLPRTREGVPWIALAFEAQIMPDVPCEEHDLKMDVIITEDRVIRPGDG